MHAKTNSTAFRALTASLVLITASPALAQCPLEEISGASASHFGHAVAVDGTRAAVGAPYEVTGTTGNGVVHSYELLGGTWHETQALTLPSGVSFPEFGIAIAMQGNNLLVGAPKEPNPGSDWQGAVHRYQHDGNAWQYKGELIGFFGGVPGPDFGTALCLDGNLLVTGAPNYLNGYGVVAVFSAPSFTPFAEALVHDIKPYDGWGTVVHTDGVKLLGGAPHQDQARGAAYVCKKTQFYYTVETKLLAPDGGSNDQFGYSAAIQGNVALVGAPGHGPDPAHPGAVYVFRLDASVWGFDQKIVPSDVEPNQAFGTSIAIDGPNLLVGAYGDSDLGKAAGAVYQFREVNGTWLQVGKLLAPSGKAADEFGHAVALSGGRAFVGARKHDGACPTNPNCDSGSTYVFETAQDSWTYGHCASAAPCGNLDDFGGCLNSTGMGGILSSCAPSSVGMDELRLEARWVPANAVGLFFMGGAQVQAPFGAGQLLVSSSGTGLYRYPVANSGPVGVLTLGPGLIGYSHANFPLAGQIAAGQTWNFQTWCRDPGGPCAAAFNLTNGVQVTFPP